MPDSLATVTKIQMDIEDCLRNVGEVFRAFRDQDSTCISYGVLSSDRRWFVKHSDHPRGLASRASVQSKHGRAPRRFAPPEQQIRDREWRRAGL